MNLTTSEPQVSSGQLLNGQALLKDQGIELEEVNNLPAANRGLETVLTTRDRFDVARHPTLKVLREKAAELAAKEGTINLWADQIEITPDLAAWFLTKNFSGNRKQTAADLKKYARAMKRKHWRLTGETIIFSEEGVLLNGQHRLESCIASGESFITMVVYGVPQSAFPQLDQGHNRKPDSVLAEILNGPVRLASAFLMRYLGPVILNAHVTVGDVQDTLFDYPLLKTATDAVIQVIGKGHPLLDRRPQVIVLYFFVLSTRPELANEFLSRIVTSIGFTETDPILHLRELLLSPTKKGSDLETLMNVEGLCIRALIAYLRGTTIEKGKLRWKKNETPFYEPVPFFVVKSPEAGPAASAVEFQELPQ